MSEEAEMAGGWLSSHRQSQSPSAHLEGKSGLLQEQGLTAIFSVAIGLKIVHDFTDQEVFWLQ